MGFFKNTALAASIWLGGIVAAAANSPIAAPYTCLRNFYVNTSGSDSHNCTDNSANACATLQGANNNIALQGGDCVNVGPGTYSGNQNLTKGGSAASTDAGGKLNGFVTYIGAANNASIISMTGAGQAVNLIGNYLIFDRFEVNGHSIADANAGYLIQVGDNRTTTKFHHHIILNNLVHDWGGGGIALQGNDYAIIAGNVVYNTALTSTFEDSGITIYEPKSAGSFTTYPFDTQVFHFQILRNITHDNTEGPSIPAAQHTDGNGISLDDFGNVQANAVGGQYPYETLIEGNLSYHNGGRGIDSSGCNPPAGTPPSVCINKLTVINNTAYNNCTDATFLAQYPQSCGELTFFGGVTNSTFTNNIAWLVANPSVTQAFRITGDGATCSDNIWKNNLTYTGTTGQNATSIDAGCVASPNNPLLGTNPQLTSVPVDFHPLSGSPVLGAGIAGPTGYVLNTPDGGATQPSPPNIGAYSIGF